jgi:hypothetical protein
VGSRGGDHWFGMIALCTWPEAHSQILVKRWLVLAVPSPDSVADKNLCTSARWSAASAQFRNEWLSVKINKDQNCGYEKN